MANLRLAKEVGAQRVWCRSDSKIATEQINKVFQTRDPKLLKYYHAFEKLRGQFEEVQVTHISQEVNDKADKLAQLATSPKLGQLKTFILHLVPKPNISRKNVYRWKKPSRGRDRRYSTT